MDTVIKSTNSYWNILKDLSNEMKLDLIARLSNSLLHEEKSKSVSASRYYGIWKDSDSLDADELNKTIKKDRRFKDDIEAF